MRELAFCVCVLIAMMIQASARVEDSDPVSINPQICNDGEIPISFAGAYRTDGLFGYTWVVMGWMRVDAHKCREIGKANTSIGLLREGKPALYIALNYRDSQGKLHYPKFDSAPKGWEKDDRPLCVDRDSSFKYETGNNDNGPDRECQSGHVQIPGTFETPGLTMTLGYNPNGRDPIGIGNPDMRIAIGEADASKTDDAKTKESDSGGMSFLTLLVEAMKEHAKEHPQQPPQQPPPQQPSQEHPQEPPQQHADEHHNTNEELFVDIVNNALFGTGAPPLRRATCPAEDSIVTGWLCNDLDICATPSFVNGNNWSDKRNADAVQTELRNYLKSHLLHAPAAISIKVGEINRVMFSRQIDNPCDPNLFSHSFTVHWASNH